MIKEELNTQIHKRIFNELTKYTKWFNTHGAYSLYVSEFINYLSVIISSRVKKNNLPGLRLTGRILTHRSSNISASIKIIRVGNGNKRT